MLIQTLWIKRRDDDVPELLEAWDDYSFENNPDGFHVACDQALASVGEGQIEAVRYIRLSLRDDVLDRAFEDVEMEASILDYSEKIKPATK